MIKKILLTLLITAIGIINYSYASWIGYGVVGDYFTNVNNNSIDLKIDSYGNFNSEIGNIEKGLFAIYNSNDIVDYFYRNTDNIISLYTSKGKNSFVPGSSYGPNGGTLIYFYLCDSIEGNFTSFSNCVKYENTGANIAFLGEIISNITLNDNIYYGDAYSCSNCRPDLGWTHPFFAINISNYGKVLLFLVKLDSGTFEYGLNSIDENYYGFGLNYEYTDLYNFDTFPLSLIGTSPFNGGGSSGGGDIVSNIDYTCTKEIALKWYEKNGYSSKLCYGGFNNFNLFTGAVNDLPFYGTGLDIEEIWFNSAQYRIYGDIGTGMGYNDWFHYWRLVYNSYYRTINEGGVMGNPFNNTPLVLFTYFSAVNQFGRNFRDKDILEYCDLKLYTSDYSSVYSGNYGNKVCSPLVWLEESVNNLNSSGDVNIGVNINGNFGTGNSGQNFIDGQSFIQSFVKFIDSDKFKGTNTGATGIIPGYIVLVLCALIFFRFIMH